MALGQTVRNAAAQPVSQFSQTAFIFGVLGFAFVFYVTLRGHLPKWLGLLGLGGAAGTAAPGSTNAAPAAGGAGNVVQFPTLPQLGTVVQ